MKRLLALILAMALIFCFTACQVEITTSGETEAEVAKELTAEEVLAKSLEATNGVTSVGADFIMDMEITAEGETVDMDITGAMEFDQEKKLGYMEMKMEAQGMNIDAVTYTDFSGEDIVVYTGTMGMWVKQTTPASEASSLGIGSGGIDGIKSYLDGVENATVSKEGDDYKVVGNIGDMLSETVMNSAMSNVASVDSLTEDVVAQIIDCFKDIEFVIYIDGETFYLTSFEMDMSKAMKEVFGKIPELAEANIEDIKFIAKYDYRDYNADINVEIPEEALNAAEIPAA